MKAKNKKTFPTKDEINEPAVKKNCSLYSFLCAAKGSWRNSIYIECNACSYGRKKLCRGFLLAPDCNGKPIVVPIDAITDNSGLCPDKEECQATITCKAFDSLYASWIEWNISSSELCPLLQISECRSCM